jgi:acyl carrier protein
MDRSEMLMDYIKRELLRGRTPNLKLEDNLLDSGIINSLGLLQLVAFIEETLGIEVPVEDVVYENFQSVATLSGYLSTRKTAI